MEGVKPGYLDILVQTEAVLNRRKKRRKKGPNGVGNRAMED